jgi:bifunctional DNA-binding transcriptional regulator/antitoxin component of YhaV-PrlF toxin-antitoxin module
MSYKITSSGQVSIPASVRRRWQTSRVDVEDHGDYVVVRPAPEDPVAAVRGIFKGRIRTTTDEMRHEVREEERRAMERKEAQYRR